MGEPLRRLTLQKVTFVWGKEQKQCFETLKNCLVNVKTLGHLRHDATKTQLVTDASNVRLEAVLLQEHRSETRAISY